MPLRSATHGVKFLTLSVVWISLAHVSVAYTASLCERTKAAAGEKQKQRGEINTKEPSRRNEAIEEAADGRRACSKLHRGAPAEPTFQERSSGTRLGWDELKIGDGCRCSNPHHGHGRIW